MTAFALAILPADLLVGQLAEERDIPARLAFETFPVGADADDAKRRARPAARGDGQVDALVRDQGRHHEKGPARTGPGRMVELGVHRRIHDRGLAAVVSQDPGRHESRVRREAVHARRPSTRPTGPARPSPDGRAPRRGAPVRRAPK